MAKRTDIKVERKKKRNSKSYYYYSP